MSTSCRKRSMRKWRNCTFLPSLRRSMSPLRNKQIYTCCRGQRQESMSQPGGQVTTGGDSFKDFIVGFITSSLDSYIESLRLLNTHSVPFSCTCLVHRRLLSDSMMRSRSSVQEGFGIHRVASEMVFSVSHPGADAPLCTQRRYTLSVVVWARFATAANRRERALRYSPGRVVVQSEC